MCSHNVFISYARDDFEVIKRIIRALDHQGLSCWVDQDNIRWGESFPSALHNAIESSQYIIFCISENYTKSSWARKEVELALAISQDMEGSNRPHLLPLLLEDIPDHLKSLPFLQTLQYRVYNGDPTRLAVAIAHLGLTPTRETGREWANSSPLSYSFEEILRYESWLPLDRRRAIATCLLDILPDLKSHRKNHIRELNALWKSLPIMTDRRNPAWVRVNTTHSVEGNRLTIGFKNTTCEYRVTDPLKLGCFNCGYYAGAQFRKATIAQLMEQLRRGFAHAFNLGRRFDVVEFLSDGSFLSDKEMDDEAKIRIFESLASMPYIKRVLVESTPEHIYSQREEVPALLEVLRKDQILEIGVGFETADDFVRKTCINKGFLMAHFERAVTHLANINLSYDNQCTVVAYLLVKPAFLSVGEAIDDLIYSLRYLSELSKRLGIRIVPKLEPAAIADGTVLSYLHRLSDNANLFRYNPVNYWMILEILTRAFLDPSCHPAYNEIRIGAREDMDDIIKVPAVYRRDGRFDQFDYVLYDAIQRYNSHRDIFQVYAVIRETYPRGIKHLLSPNSSLGAWTRSELNESDVANSRNDSFEVSAIHSLLTNPDNESILEEAASSANLDSQFLRKIYGCLDILEGYVTSRSASIQSRFKEILQNSESRISSAELEKFQYIVSECFDNSELDLFEIRMIDAKLESDDLLRLFFEATNFRSGRSHVLWSEVPIESNEHGV